MVNGWVDSPLKAVCIKIQDGTHFSPVVNGGKYLYVTSRNIGHGTFDVSDAQRIDASQHSKIYERCDVKYGDLLLTKDGANTGNATINHLREEFSLLSSVAFLRFDPNQHDARFYLQQILSHKGQQQIKDAMSGNAITRLTLEKIKNLSFKVAPLPEQHCIAEVLSDADNLITSLEKLIAKKKAIKQGAMQELLTGKKRLPGFSGEWVEHNLIANSKLKARIGWQGLTTAEYLPQGNYILITGTDFENGRINWSTCSYVEKKRYDQDPHIQIQNGDVLITKDGTIGKVAFVKSLPKPATLNSGVFVIRPTIAGRYDSGFIFHILNSAIFDSFLSKLSAGSTINHLYQKDFGAFSFFAPSALDEQAAIATILSDIDAEIEQLEKKLAKYRLIKQGMMQELLTGRIRLIEVERKSQKASKGHNEKYDDAIAISAIVNAFYDERFYLGRVKVQKLLYLLRRKQEADVSGFKKKAAGPYNEQVRYNGGESIAVKEGYVVRKGSKMGSTFSKGKSIETALQYAGSMQKDIEWLYQKFKYYNTNKETNNLEVLATVDMAVCEIEMAGKAVTLDAVKNVIRSNKEWAPKLKKVFFTDAAIERAITESKELFA